METNVADQVQVVQDLYAAFGRGDMPTILSLLDEEIDWHFFGQQQDVPFAGYWRGHQQMIAFFTRVAETCEVLEFGPHEIICKDDYVFSLGRERVRARQTGRVFETDWVHVFQIRDGKIVRLREYYDTATMARAF